MYGKAQISHNHTHNSMHLPWSTSKILLVTLFTLTLCSGILGYLGPRYGKRLPFRPTGGEVSQIVGRSSGPRTIQSRSQARFYAGSRYGGKRSFWPSLMTNDVDSLDSVAGNSLPYDCIYLPYVGVRCNILRSDTSNDHDPEEGSEMPSYGGSPRTSIIDTIPSGSGSEN